MVWLWLCFFGISMIGCVGVWFFFMICCFMCDFLLIIDFVVDVDVYYVLCLFVVFGGLVVEFEWWLEWYSYC